MKKIIGLSLIAATSMLIVGCGGGSSSSTANSAKITGTVPGTLIEAFCDNNYYAQVTSTNNGTSEHPFEITVPTNTNCRLIMTTNENDPANRVITPIGFSNGNTIVVSGDINLGNIPLELNYQNADDKDGDHVVDTALNVNPNGASVNNNPVHDSDGNGMVDNYDDNNDNNVPNAYEDDDHDGKPNLHDDDNGNGVPDFDEAGHNGNENAQNGNDSGMDNGQNDANHNGNENGQNDTNHNGNDNGQNGNDSGMENGQNENDSGMENGQDDSNHNGNDNDMNNTNNG